MHLMWLSSPLFWKMEQNCHPSLRLFSYLKSHQIWKNGWRQNVIWYQNSISVEILYKFFNNLRDRPNIDICMNDVVPDKHRRFTYPTQLWGLKILKFLHLSFTNKSPDNRTLVLVYQMKEFHSNNLVEIYRHPLYAKNIWGSPGH